MSPPRSGFLRAQLRDRRWSASNGVSRRRWVRAEFLGDDAARSELKASLRSHMPRRYPHIEAVFVFERRLDTYPVIPDGEIISVRPSLTKAHSHAETCLSCGLRLRCSGIRISEGISGGSRKRPRRRHYLRRRLDGSGA